MGTIGQRIVLMGALALSLLAVGFAMKTYHSPGVGFTKFVCVGSKMEAKATDAFKSTRHWVYPNSDGYDGTFYAQIALSPLLTDPQLAHSLDNPPYRARRILFCWTAYLGGLGHPQWIVHAYSLQNIAFWLANGVLLWVWLPPTCWFNVLRWLGIQLSAGWLGSIERSLVDGPALFLLLLAVWAGERGRPWWSAILFGLSVLGRETNLLAGLILLPSRSNPSKSWGDFAGRFALAAAPLALWTAYVHQFVEWGPGPTGDNVTTPFRGLLLRVQELQNDFAIYSRSVFYWTAVLSFVSLGPQVAFFLSRFDWSSPWWRIGIAYSFLSLCLGPLVMEGYPAAFSRVLLPLLVAFNLGLKPDREGWFYLVLGNLGFLQGLDGLQIRP